MIYLRFNKKIFLDSPHFMDFPDHTGGQKSNVQYNLVTF